MNQFWKWTKNEATSGRTLTLEGYIAQESWYDDEVTPKDFRDALCAEQGDVTVRINSPGGDVFAAAQIYDMLKEYPGSVTVHVDGYAASAASVIAMAGDSVMISPVSYLMIHNPQTFAWGEESDMLSGYEMLREVKDGIINAYAEKTGLPREQLSDMMSKTTWMSAHKAVELGFADGILYSGDDAPSESAPAGILFDRLTVTNALLGKMARRKPAEQPRAPQNAGAPAAQLHKRLNLLKQD